MPSTNIVLCSAFIVFSRHLNTLLLCQGLPRATAFLDQVTSCLPDWAASLAPWPVVTWPQFVEFLHQAVNPLAGEEHLKVVPQKFPSEGS